MVQRPALVATSFALAASLVLGVVTAAIRTADVHAQAVGSPPGEPVPDVPVPVVQAPDGPNVAVVPYCADTTGSLGAVNTQNALLADGRFNVVDVIDGDVVQPTADDILATYDCMVASTDNRCGFPNPGVFDPAAETLAGVANAGGGVVLTAFGWSGPGGIGWGPAIFGPDLSPFNQAGLGNGGHGGHRWCQHGAAVRRAA